jgi:hypothetical protein
MSENNQTPGEETLSDEQLAQVAGGIGPGVVTPPKASLGEMASQMAGTVAPGVIAKVSGPAVSVAIPTTLADGTSGEIAKDKTKFMPGVGIIK